MPFTYYRYTAPINVRQTAATAANTTIWAMRNDTASTKIIFIESIEVIMAFDTATPLTRSLQRYDLIRFSAATPTGGTSITPVATDSSAPATQITSVLFAAAGLTVTGVSFGSPILTFGVPAVDGANLVYQSSNIPIVLAAGEGICIRLNVTAVAGQSITGFINWSER